MIRANTKPRERPLIQGAVASFREKLGALVSGRPLHKPGVIRYHREDFAEVIAQTRLSDPVAMARRMGQLLRVGHDKIDRLTSADDLFREMDFDALVGSARGRYEEALHAAKLDVDVDARYRAFVTRVTKPGPMMNDLIARCVDAEMRGFVLAEWTTERMTRGEFASYDTIGGIERRDRDAYRLEEDEYGRPAKLEIWTADESTFRSDQYTGVTRHIGAGYRPQRQVVLLPTDADWQRFLMMSYPERIGSVGGIARYAMAFPWYFFATHLRQWMMVLGERTGTPILVAEFSPNPDAGISADYKMTSEEMLEILELIQTNFRGLVPAGYKISAVATGAEGLAQLLTMLYQTCWSMIDLAILGEIVSGGAQAQGGTLGANQSILNATFGGHVAAGHRRVAGYLAPMLEFLIELNFGEQVDVECEFAALDPAKDAARIAAVEKGVAIGSIHRHEPWVREILGAPPLDDELLAETKSAILAARRYGLDSEVEQEQALEAAGVSVDDVMAIIDRVTDGDMSDTLAATLLAPKMGVTFEEALQIVVAEKARLGTVQAGVGDGLEIGSGVGSGSADVQGLALNGAQVTALQGMLASLSPTAEAPLAPEAAVLMILSAFPAIPEDRVRAMVNAQVVTTPSTPSAPAAPAAVPAPVEEAADVDAVPDSSGRYVPPREIARAAARGLEVAGRHRAEWTPDPRSLAVGRLLASREPLTPRQVEQVAAWLEMAQPGALDTLEGVEWLLHGGDGALAWCDSVEDAEEPAAPAAPAGTTPPPEEPFGEAGVALDVARVRLAGVLSDLRRRVTPGYDASRLPPIRCDDVARALAPSASRSDRDRRADEIRSAIGRELVELFADTPTDETEVQRRYDAACVRLVRGLR